MSKKFTLFSCECLKPYKVLKKNDLFGSVIFVEFDGEHRELEKCPDCGIDLEKTRSIRQRNLARLSPVHGGDF